MPAFTNKACGDQYTTAATIAFVHGSPGGYVVVANQPVFYSLAHGINGQEEWSEDYPGSVGSIALGSNVIGVQVRNQVAGQVATASAVLVAPGRPVPTPGSTGTATPASANMVTGIIPAAGTTPTAGSGFTYTHTNATGIYVFTFTTAFGSTPTILLTYGPGGALASPFVEVTASAASGFTVHTGNAGVAADEPFMFAALMTL